LGSLLLDPRSGRFLIGFLGRSFGYLPNPIFTFPLGCFDAGFAGVGDLACFNLLAIVEATLRSMVGRVIRAFEQCYLGAA